MRDLTEKQFQSRLTDHGITETPMGSILGIRYFVLGNTNVPGVYDRNGKFYRRETLGKLLRKRSKEERNDAA